MNSPMMQLSEWWATAKKNSPLNIKSPVCVSSINQDGYPSGRVVDLKAVDEHGVVFCTSYNSPKGQQLEEDNRVALTAWWDHAGMQIRIIGDAERITDAEADTYWQSRNQDGRITSVSFEQSAKANSIQEVEEAFSKAKTDLSDAEIKRPAAWGGYRVRPIEIEFLKFRQDRLHERELFTKSVEGWEKTILQP